MKFRRKCSGQHPAKGKMTQRSFYSVVLLISKHSDSTAKYVFGKPPCILRSTFHIKDNHLRLAVLLHHQCCFKLMVRSFSSSENNLPCFTYSRLGKSFSSFVPDFWSLVSPLCPVFTRTNAVTKPAFSRTVVLVGSELVQKNYFTCLQYVTRYC